MTLSSVAWRLAGLLALVCANGFFVAAEFSIVTVRKTRIDQLIAEGHSTALAVRRAISAPDRYIAATQVGITMASLGLGWIGEPSLAALLQPSLAFLPATLAVTTAHTVAVAIAFTLITAVEIVLGELVPKWIALERAETTSLLVVRPMELFMRLLWPFIHLLHGTAQLIVTAVGLHGEGHRGGVHSEEELKMLVTASQEAGVLEEQEEQMLHRVFDFADLTAGQVMVPRTELVAVATDTPRDDLLELLSRTGHTRLPVYRANIDDIVGILYVNDLLRPLDRGGAINAGALAREALMVPETLPADDVLAEMRRRNVREALVIDEYGGTAGLVTFWSLMERIIGNLGAPTGESLRIHTLDDGSAEIDGLVFVSDVNQQFSLHIDEDTYTTVGGFVLGQLGRRPQLGDTVAIENRTMRVDALDGIRVARVWLSAPVSQPDDDKRSP
ncbi:MAG TPA: hemolysin family protein [Vicinamibacterales bacterium]|nr:hemolysin family protein [Vicinamibacterales bacterium]